jgi:hypothetical protein
LNLSAYEIALIAGGFTIIGTLLGAWITYRNALEIQKVTEFNKAAALFRTTFTDELRELKRLIEYDKVISEDKVLQMLNSCRTKFDNACINFRPYIIQSQKVRFDNAWREYCHPQGGDPKQMPDPYLEYFIDIPIHDSITLIIEKIEKLLWFAEPI